MSEQIKVRRADASAGIEALIMLAITPELDASVNRAARKALESMGIDPARFTVCTGEAHSNPHIDNCGQCAPRWGIVGPEIKVT